MRHSVVRSPLARILGENSPSIQFARFVVALWLLTHAGRLAAAADYFEFQGAVQFASGTFGLPPLKPNDPIVGGFNIERSAAMSLPGATADRQDYRVQRYHGLFGRLGNIDVRADEFDVRIYNDLPQGTNPVADVITIVWASDLSPTPSPLFVNDIPRTAGQFVVSFFKDGGAAYETPSLDALDLLESFDRSLLVLGDTAGPTGADVFGRVDQWNQLPGLPGDFDHDADVDGSDLLTWQGSVGGQDELALAPWKSYFGTGDVPLETIAVPEPAAVVAALITAAWTCALQRRRLA